MTALVDGIDLGIEGIEGAEEIGAGGFAVVYRARQPAFGRTVAVKVLSVSGLDDHNRLRFERERRAMGSLSDHPGIVTVYDAGFTRDNRPYLVMAYLPRGSLAERVTSEGVLSWEEASRVAVRLAGALEVAHRAGVIHRDIKPGNVLMSDYREPMLADFGIARISGGQETRSGVITASIPHAAPEILDGHRPTEAADIYSLGSTIYSVIAGSPAFVRETDESIMPLIVRINTEPVPSLTDRGVPAPIAAVLERSMAKSPSDRQRSAADFGHEMRRAQQEAGLVPTEMVLASGHAEPPQVGDETVVVDAPDIRIDEPTPPPAPPEPPPAPPAPPEPPPAPPEPPPTPPTRETPTPPPPTPPPEPPKPRPLARWLVAAALVVAVGGVIAFLALRDDGSTGVAGPEPTAAPATPDAATPEPETTPPPATATPPPEGPDEVVTEPVFVSLLTAADGAAGDVFGRHTSTDGNTLVVGARLAENDAGVTGGQAYVFERDGDTWIERGHLAASDPGEGDEFGRPVVVDGDRLLVGARFDDTAAGENAGSVYAFAPDAAAPAGWSETAKLEASDAEAEDGLAISMALDGDLVVVGAAVEDHDGLINAGAVYVYRDQGGSWVEEAKLVASDGADRDRFGSSVAVSDDTIVVGARTRDLPGGSDEGAVYVFVDDGGGWVETDRITLDGAAPGDQLGWFVDRRGDTIVATAPFEEVDGVTDAGAAYVFTATGDGWEQRGRLTAPEPQELGQFGVVVAFHGDRVLIGDEFADNGDAVDSGAVHAFRPDDSGEWIWEFTIVAPDPQTDDHFGASVVVAGDQALIGAQRDDTEIGEDSGSLSVFALPPAG